MVDTERRVFEWEQKVLRVERDFRVEGEVRVNPEEPPIDQVLSIECRLVDVVTEPVAEGLLIAGKMIPFLVCQATVASGPDVPAAMTYCSIKGEPISFSYMLELPTVPAGDRVKTDCRVFRVSAEPGDHHVIRVAGDILVVSIIVAPEREELVVNAQVQPPAALNVAKEVFRVTEPLGTYQGRAQVQTVLDLPYLCPPVFRVLWTRATPVNLHWESGKGKIKIEGDLSVTMVYLSRNEEDREELMKVEWSREAGPALHWHLEIDGQNIGEDTRFLPIVTVPFCSAESYGKENLRFEALVLAEVAPYRLIEGEVVVDLSAPELILDINRRRLELEDVLADQIAILPVERLLELPAGRPELGRVLHCQVLANRISGECGTGKILLEGSTEIKLLYTAGDGESFPGVYTAAWEKTTALAWAESVQVSVAEEGFRAEVEGNVLGVSLEPVDGRRVRLLMEVMVRTRVLEQKHLSVVDDWAVVPKVAPGTRSTMIFYLTQPGDTWWKVARKYQTTMEALAQENHLSLSEPLPAGKRLIIPMATMAKITTLK